MPHMLSANTIMPRTFSSVVTVICILWLVSISPTASRSVWSASCTWSHSSRILSGSSITERTVCCTLRRLSWVAAIISASFVATSSYDMSWIARSASSHAFATMLSSRASASFAATTYASINCRSCAVVVVVRLWDNAPSCSCCGSNALCWSSRMHSCMISSIASKCVASIVGGTVMSLFLVGQNFRRTWTRIPQNRNLGHFILGHFLISRLATSMSA